MEKEVSDTDNKLVIHHDTLKKLRRRLEIIDQMHSAPTVYCAAVVEVVRRRRFSDHFQEWASQLCEQQQVVHKDECEKRLQFHAFIKHHFLQGLFPGFLDVVPAFATKMPPVFDVELPPVEPSDLEYLKKEVPELSDKLDMSNLLERSKGDAKTEETQAEAVDAASAEDAAAVAEAAAGPAMSGSVAVELSTSEEGTLEGEKDELVVLDLPATGEVGDSVEVLADEPEPPAQGAATDPQHAAAPSPEEDDFTTADFYIDESMPSSMTDSAGRKLAELQQALQEKISLIESRDSQIQLQLQQLENREARIEEMTAQLESSQVLATSLTAQLEEKEKAFLDQSRGLEQKELEIRNKQGMLEDKNSILQQKDEKLERLNGEMTELQTQIKDKEKVISELQGELDIQERQVKELTVESGTKDKLLEDLRQGAEEQSSRHEKLRKELDQQTRSLEASKAQIQDLESQLSLTQGNLDKCQHHLTHICSKLRQDVTDVNQMVTSQQVSLCDEIGMLGQQVLAMVSKLEESQRSELIQQHRASQSQQVLEHELELEKLRTEMESRVKEQEEEVSSHDLKLDQKEQEVDDIRHRLGETEQALRLLQRDQASTEEMLTQKFMREKNEIQSMLQTEYEEKLERVNRQVEETATERESLMSELRELKERIAEEPDPRTLSEVRKTAISHRNLIC